MDGWHYHRGTDEDSLMSHSHAHEEGHTHPGLGPAFREHPPVPPHVLDKIARIVVAAEKRKDRE